MIKKGLDFTFQMAIKFGKILKWKSVFRVVGGGGGVEGGYQQTNSVKNFESYLLMDPYLQLFQKNDSFWQQNITQDRKSFITQSKLIF